MGPGGPPASNGEGGAAAGRAGAGFVGCFIVALVLFIATITALATWVAGALLGVIAPGAAPSAATAVAVVVVLVIAVALAIRAFASTIRPLAELGEAAERLADGEPDVRVTPRGPAPVRGLAASFNAMAERLDRSRDDRRALLADVTHELRTPLTVVPGGIEAMLDGVHPMDEDHLAPLLAETAVMDRLLDDLRTLSLAEAGALPLHREPVDLAVARATRSVRRTGPARVRAASTLSVAGDGPVVTSVDPVRVREILVNLVANALRHTPAGGAVTVEVGDGRGRGAARRARHRRRHRPGRTCRACSTGSTGGRTRAARAWASRSSATSRRRTAGRSASRATGCRAAGRVFRVRLPAARLRRRRSGEPAGAPAQRATSATPSAEHEHRRRQPGRAGLDRRGRPGDRLDAVRRPGGIEVDAGLARRVAGRVGAHVQLGARRCGRLARGGGRIRRRLLLAAARGVDRGRFAVDRTMPRSASGALEARRTPRCLGAGASEAGASDASCRAGRAGGRLVVLGDGGLGLRGGRAAAARGQARRRRRGRRRCPGRRARCRPGSANENLGPDSVARSPRMPVGRSSAACSGVSRKSRVRAGAGSSGIAAAIERRSWWSAAQSAHAATSAVARSSSGPVGVARGVRGDQLEVVVGVLAVGQVGHARFPDGGGAGSVPALRARGRGARDEPGSDERRAREHEQDRDPEPRIRGPRARRSPPGPRASRRRRLGSAWLPARSPP